MTGRDGPRSWTRSRIYDVLAGVKGAVPKIEADEVTANDSFTDPSGNTYNGAVGLLNQAGYTNGDKLYLPLANDAKGRNTSNGSYNFVSANGLDTLYDDSLFPGTVGVGLTAKIDPNGDAIDIRFKDFEGTEEVIGEETGITSDIVTVGPFDFDPDTDIARVLPEWRNQDGTTQISGQPFLMFLTVEL